MTGDVADLARRADLTVVVERRACVGIFSRFRINDLEVVHQIWASSNLLIRHHPRRQMLLLTRLITRARD